MVIGSVPLEKHQSLCWQGPCAAYLQQHDELANWVTWILESKQRCSSQGRMALDLVQDLAH
jgi:hypothetical protein